MSIIEPDVFWTDILLGVVSIGLGILLLASKNSWGRVFISLSLATFFGAFYHGLINTTTVFWGDILWTTTLGFFALTSVLLIDESFRHNRNLRYVLVVGWVSYMVFAVIISEAFLWALVLQALAIALLVTRYFTSMRKGLRTQARKRSDALLVSFLIVNVVAILLQQMRVNFGSPYSHNTIFHILELPVVVLLYYFVSSISRQNK